MAGAAHWHPFSDMATLDGELVLDRGDGAVIYDIDGREYLDATGGLWFCNVGHGRRELAEVAYRQMRRLAAYSTFGHYTHPYATPLAERLRDLAPVNEGAVFFTTGGSEAVETAMKIVRRYWRSIGEENRDLVIARDGAYHGMSAYGTSLAGIPANASGYGALVNGIVHVARDDTTEIEDVLTRLGSRVAAFIGEPVIGAGGIYPPEAGYWKRVQALCRDHGVLLVADEVVTGFGRLGHWFGSSRFGLEPDLVTVAKGVTSGYQPLGAVIAGARVQAPFWDGRAGPFRHGYTYSGHPVACQVALANLAILDSERLPDRAAELEPLFTARIRKLADHAIVDDARAIGLMGAIELRADLLAAEPDLPGRLVTELAARGVLTRALASGAIQLSPPLVIEASQVVELVDAIRDALDAIAASPPPDSTHRAPARGPRELDRSPTTGAPRAYDPNPPKL